MDSVLSVVSIVVSVIALIIYSYLEKKKPILTAAIKVVKSGNIATALKLIIVNSGSFPATDIRIFCPTLNNVIKNLNLNNISKKDFEHCLSVWA